ncbi:MAG: polyamine aminopropyltransferase, partial [Desulfobacterales bacterium]|nr:polyamine aminopropyltransferase [Desulfobacterales bacterium]
MANVSAILKISIFATGCAGIVAEFVLSTLATYIVGNAVFQWTIVMSLMLFSMGIGSRISKTFQNHLLDTFILIEFALSIFCALSAITAYGLSAYTQSINLIIYLLSMIIGAMIGLEIPLVTRMNQAYEELCVNISSVMEKDYYGALFGGIFFAFFALPYFGFTYTPIILGTINFIVASLFIWFLFDLIHKKKTIVISFIICAITLILLSVLAKPIIMYGEQSQYKDKIIYSLQTKYQKIVITQWKNNYWLFINRQEQFSTFDEEKYHEPLVHPAMMTTINRNNILILGGGDGLALREILKHNDVKTVTIVDIDPDMTSLGKTYPILLKINNNSMLDSRVNIINKDAGIFLKEDNKLYDVIIIDLPDPDTIDLMHLYSEGFYTLVGKHLSVGGTMVTQATSPIFSKKAFLCIIKTIEAAGFSAFPYHNHIPTMGEWGFVMGSLKMSPHQLKKRVIEQNYNILDTRF